MLGARSVLSRRRLGFEEMRRNREGGSEMCDSGALRSLILRGCISGGFGWCLDTFFDG